MSRGTLLEKGRDVIIDRGGCMSKGQHMGRDPSRGLEGRDDSSGPRHWGPWMRAVENQRKLFQAEVTGWEWRFGCISVDCVENGSLRQYWRQGEEGWGEACGHGEEATPFPPHLSFLGSVSEGLWQRWDFLARRWGNGVRETCSHSKSVVIPCLWKHTI